MFCCHQISCLSLHVISGTMKFTSLGTSLHSCQVTGSHASVPAHTWPSKERLGLGIFSSGELNQN